jgi:hypothetical protein
LLPVLAGGIERKKNQNILRNNFAKTKSGRLAAMA